MGLVLGRTGAVSVDLSQRTSHPAVYAVGDCCEVYHRVSKKWTYAPLGDIANKQGRVAGRNIAGFPLIFPGIVGAQAVGPQGAVSRINTLSAALWSGLSIDEAAYLDLAYSPPFSHAWDLIHIAAQKLVKKVQKSRG